MKTALSSVLGAALVAALLTAPAHADSTPAPATLVTGTMSKSFLNLKKGAAVKVVGVSTSEVDIVGQASTIQFFFDPPASTWPREIERVVETRANGKKRGAFSHGEVKVSGNVASFSGNGAAPVSKFSFTVQ
jgi:hypothetical protein